MRRLMFDARPGARKHGWDNTQRRPSNGLDRRLFRTARVCQVETSREASLFAHAEDKCMRVSRSVFIASSLPHPA